MGYETQLNDVIEQDLEKLKEMEVGTETYGTTVDVVTKLMDRAIEIKKLEGESKDKTETRKDDRRDRIAKNLINVFTIITSVGLAVWGTKKSFEFEKEGTITTIMGRGFINKLLPKK